MAQWDHGNVGIMLRECSHEECLWSQIHLYALAPEGYVCICRFANPLISGWLKLDSKFPSDYFHMCSPIKQVKAKKRCADDTPIEPPAFQPQPDLDSHNGPAMYLERHEIGPWLKAICDHGGSRGSAGLKHAVCDFFKLRGALRPSEALQLVPANFDTDLPGKYKLIVQDNGFANSNIGKLHKRRVLPLDEKAAALLEVLFSETGLTVTEQNLKWTRGCKLPCFPGGGLGRVSQTPVTLQAHNDASRKAASVFAKDMQEPAFLGLSGNSMRRTAVHLFESAKVAPSVGMHFTGHESVEVYMRYASQPSMRQLEQVSTACFGAAALPEDWLQ